MGPGERRIGGETNKGISALLFERETHAPQNGGWGFRLSFCTKISLIKAKRSRHLIPWALLGQSDAWDRIPAPRGKWRRAEVGLGLMWIGL